MIALDKYRNILLPRFDTFGDVVLMEGLIRAILEQAPDAKIDLLVRDSYEQLAELFPQRLNWNTVNIVNPHTRKADKDQAEILLGKLVDRVYDLALFTTYDRTWADDLVAAKISSCLRVAFGEPSPIQDYLLQILGTLGIHSSLCPYDEFVPVERNIPETDRYQVLWQKIKGFPDKLPNPQLFVSEDIDIRGDEIIQEIGLAEERFVICCPSGTANVSHKTWPVEYFARIIAHLENNHNLKTLIVGHELEKPNLDKVSILSEGLGAKPKLWIGQEGDIPLLCSLVKKAFFYIGNDTGPMHMSAALNKPVIAIFGGGTWPRFVPRTKTGRVFYFPLPCFTCGWNCVYDEVFCINLISPDIVIEELNAFHTKYMKGSGDFKIIKIEPEINDLYTILEKAINCLRLSKNRIKLNNEKFNILNMRLENCESDRAERLKVINEIGIKLDSADAMSKSRMQVINKLSIQHAEKIKELENDREARLKVIKELQVFDIRGMGFKKACLFFIRKAFKLMSKN